MKNIFKIKVLLDAPTRDALRKVAIMLPIWHCLKGFLDVCVQEYDHLEEVHRNTDSADVPVENATFSVEITAQQLAFLRSGEAKYILSESPEGKEFHRQLVEFRLVNYPRPKGHGLVTAQSY